MSHNLPNMPIATSPAHGAAVPASEVRPETQTTETPYADYTKGLCRAVYERGSQKRLERLREITKFYKFYEGYQIGYVNKHGKFINKKTDGDNLYHDPILATFIDIIGAQVTQSSAGHRVVARAESQIEKREAAKFANELLKDAKKDLFTPAKLQREAKYGFLMAGESYRYTYYNSGKTGKPYLKPVYEEKELSSDKRYWFCPVCQQSGEMPEIAPIETTQAQIDALDAEIGEALNEIEPENSPDGAFACPDCGFPKTERIGGYNVKYSSFQTYEVCQSGDVDVQFVSPLEMTVEGTDELITDALAVRRDRLVPRCVLEEIYPGIEFSGGDIPLNLQYQQAFEANKANSGAREFELLHFSETWLSPTVYHKYKFPRREKLASGETVEAGAKAKDLYPSGKYVAMVGDAIVDIYEQSIKECWSHAVNSASNDFHGLSEKDLLPLQEQKNELRTMKLQKVRHDSFSPLLYRPEYISGGQMPNKPGATVPVINADERIPLERIAARVQVPAIQGEIFAMEDELAAAMQSRSGAFGGTADGLPDFKGLENTLGGMELWQEHTQGRRAPLLMNRAFMERAQGYQILYLRQKHWCAAAYEQIEKRVGGNAGEWFRQSDVFNDFDIEVIPESWMPQTEAKKRMDFGQFFQFQMQLSEGDPKVLKALRKLSANIFGKGFDIEHFEGESVEAERRLEKLKQIADFIESNTVVTDINNNISPEYVALVFQETAVYAKIVQLPEDPLANYPLDAILDIHEQFIEVYSEWLRSTEGRRASLFVRTCVRELIAAHMDAKVSKNQTNLKDEQLSQLPLLESELAQNEALDEQSLEQQGNRQMQSAMIQQATAATAQEARA